MNLDQIRISFHTMERTDKRKPLTPELKGSLITFYKLGYSVARIAAEVDCHVGIFDRKSHFSCSHKGNSVSLKIGQLIMWSIFGLFVIEKYRSTMDQSVLRYGRCRYILRQLSAATKNYA